MIGVNLEHKEEFLMSEYECVDSVETLTKTLERVKNAQKEFSKYSQEQEIKYFRLRLLLRMKLEFHLLRWQ